MHRADRTANRQTVTRPTSELRQRRVLAAAAAVLLSALASWSAAAAAKQPPVNIVPEPAQAAATEGFVDVDGARLWYWDTGGSGPAVVFLHPGTGSAMSWPYQQPVFAKAGYRVIGYSRRDHYKSEIKQDAPRGGSDLSDLRKLVDALKLERFHLVGCAAGGFLAAQYAVNYPETLRSLIIAGSILNLRDPEYQELVGRVVPRNFNQMPPEFRELSPSYRTANPQGVARWLEVEKQARATPMGTAPAGGGFGPPPGAGNSTDKPTTYATLGAAAAQVPTLLMTADADLYMSPSLLYMVAEKVRPKATAVIANAGHAPFWEQPAEFNRVVLDFIGRQRR